MTGLDLFRAEKGIAEEEEPAENPDQRTDFAVSSSSELYEGEGQQAQAEARSDAEGERRGHKGEEGREGLAEITPVDACDGAAHERTNEDEGRSGGVSGNGRDQRRAKHRDEEERGDDDIAEARPCTSCDSGGAFDVAGDCRCTGEGTEERAESVGKQCATRARKFPVPQEAAFFTDANERAHIVEDVDKEKYEDEFAKAQFCGRAQIQLEQCAGRVRQREKMRGPVTKSQRNAGESYDDDSEENRAANAAGHQNGDENESSGCEKHVRVGGFAKSDEGGGISDNDVRVAQTNEGDEQADAGGGAVLQAIGNAVDDLLADFDKGQEQKRSPERNTTPRAVCQGTPRPRTME